MCIRDRIITFGAPTAHENDEELAIHCGLELVRGYERIAELGLEQRIGIATGVVFAGEVGAPSRQEYTVMGKAVNLAARLMAHTKPGQLLVDQTTRDRSEASFRFSTPQSVRFKGIDKPVQVYEVTGLKEAARQQVFGKRRPLIGRAKELEKIFELVEDVVAGNTRTAIIRGDAGIGKTRLAQEIYDISLAKGFFIGAGEALSYAKRSPYLIWISVLRRLMGLPVAGGGKEALEKLDEVVHRTDPEHTYRLPIIAGLLRIECPDNDITRHFDAQLRQENMFDFLVQYFGYLAHQAPTLLIFEDAQWIDRNSLALIAYLMRNLSGLPLLFVIIRRAFSRNFVSPHIAAIEGSDSTVDFVLGEFNRSETEQFALQQLGAAVIDPELMDFIYDSSHGNASFTEQLIGNLKSLGKIRLVPDAEAGGVRAEKVGDLTEVAVPDSLSSLIMSQLDRLGAEAKLTVKLAAVVGRQFAEEIITGSYPVAIDKEAIRESIKELEDRDIVQLMTEDQFLNYVFKNLLTRDVAYDSLLFAHRREYHRRVGLALEEIHGDSLEEWCEELARHFYQSEDDERASRYLGLAGDKAFDIYANDSAEDYYTRALERTPVDRDAKQRFKLLTMRSKVYTLVGKSDFQKHDLDEALEIARLQNDLKGQVNTLDNLAWFYARVNQLDEMKMVVDQARAILEEIEYPFGRIGINLKMGRWYWVKNQPREALEWWQRCVEDAEKHNDIKGLSSALTNCGLANKALGDFDAALEYYNRSVTLDREVGNKRSEAVNLGNIGVLYHQRGEIDKALEAYQQSIEIARSIGSKQIQAYYLGNLAMIYQAKGQRERALDTHQELLKVVQMMGYLRGQVLTLGNIGTWYHEAGRFDTALSHYRNALAIAQENKLKAEEPRILLNIGLTLHYQGRLDQAVDHLQRAVAISVEVGSKPAEDYARRYLGFALIDKGRFEEAQREFQAALEIAESIGSKVGIAAAKIGLGWLEARRTGDTATIEEGIEAARRTGDPETIIKGQVALAKLLLERNDDRKKAMDLLQNALEAAKSSGYLCDVQVVEPLINELEKNRLP